MNEEVGGSIAVDIGRQIDSQSRAARALLGWTQETLADKARVSLTALKRLGSESGLEVCESTRDQVRRAFEGNGIAFLNSNRNGSDGLESFPLDSSTSEKQTNSVGCGLFVTRLQFNPYRVRQISGVKPENKTKSMQVRQRAAKFATSNLDISQPTDLC